MTRLFKKLNLKDHETIHVLSAPASFEPELAALEGVEVLRTAKKPITFGMAFVVTKTALDGAVSELVAAAEGDVVLWFAYPKGTSKKYRCDFNRDTGWSALGEAGYEPVRQVAIDEDWSALRFRKAEYIKTMTRNPDGALSSLGKQRAAAR